MWIYIHFKVIVPRILHTVSKTSCASCFPKMMDARADRVLLACTWSLEANFNAIYSLFICPVRQQEGPASRRPSKKAPVAWRHSCRRPLVRKQRRRRARASRWISARPLQLGKPSVYVGKRLAGGFLGFSDALTDRDANSCVNCRKAERAGSVQWTPIAGLNLFT